MKPKCTFCDQRQLVTYSVSYQRVPAIKFSRPEADKVYTLVALIVSWYRDKYLPENFLVEIKQP
jgi:hypothetical protein